tara:strand:+ start:3321 stop:4073 length:753 start_codon:yes stop_codon:yes gene_type:complete
MIAFGPIGIGALFSIATPLAQGIYTKIKAKKDLDTANQQAQMYADQEEQLRKNRQAIINPYEEIKDLSGQITNPFENMGVATNAARTQAEEADIALANTLDTMRETGMGAGGATALAQAALRSKKGISDNIQQQEAQVQKIRAEGEAQANRERVAEKQRVQEAGVMGEMFQFQAQEARDIADLERTSALADRAWARQYYDNQANTQASANLIGDIGTGLTMVGGAMGGFSPGSGYLDYQAWQEEYGPQGE